MELEIFEKLKGEWVGSGPFKLGPYEGEATEYVRIEPSHKEDVYSYVRRSRIFVQGTLPMLHNETGYIRTKSIDLMLSGGTYNILEWSDKSEAFEQVAGSVDTKMMVRKISVIAADEVKWYNSMEVLFRGEWVRHVVETRFLSISRSQSPLSGNDVSAFAEFLEALQASR